MLSYIRLVRLPNVFTAIADILAGYLIMRSRTGHADYAHLGVLCGSSACLYLAGMAFNDVADWKEDALTRPDRPIPSGQISVARAVAAGVILLVAGLALAMCAHSLSITLALLLVAYIFLYNFLAKGVELLGPLTLGMCRALNILLGMSTSSTSFIQEVRSLPLWQGPLAIVLALGCYVAGITVFSAQEETGKQTRALVLGWIFCATGILFGGLGCQEFYGWICFGPLTLVLLLLTSRLRQQGTPHSARDLVRAGVLGICVFDAGLLLGNTEPVNWLPAAACSALMLPCLGLSRLIAQKEA